MSQTEVYYIIKELGGRAYTSEIKKRAKEKYPKRTLYMYIGDRLKKLAKKKVIKRLETKAHDNYWEIIDDSYSPRSKHF